MNLPTISRALVLNVRRDMKTRGYALVDTSGFLVDKKWPSQRSAVFKTLNGKSSGHYISLKECSVEWMKLLIQWQDRLLRKSLSDEKIKMNGSGLSLRNEYYKNDKSVTSWHVDGSYIRSLCVLKGPTTSIMTKLGESPIPLGWTLFITAMERRDFLKIPGTLHRRPRIKKLRRLIVNGWSCLG